MGWWGRREKREKSRVLAQTSCWFLYKVLPHHVRKYKLTKLSADASRETVSSYSMLVKQVYDCDEYVFDDSELYFSSFPAGVFFFGACCSRICGDFEV